MRNVASCSPFNRPLHEHHIIESFCVTPDNTRLTGLQSGCPFCSRMAAHGAEGTALCPRAWLQRCTSLLTQERGAQDKH